MPENPDHAAAQQVIADARQLFAWADDDDEDITDTRGDAFDREVGIQYAAYGTLLEQLHQASDGLAVENRPDASVDDLGDRRECLRQHWERVRPHLEVFAAQCRDAKYTGWSRESGGPVRRVR